VELGSRAATLENRTLMALMLAFSCRFEQMTNEVHGETRSQDTRSQDIQQRHLVSILHYMDECETEVLKSDSSRAIPSCSYVYGKTCEDLEAFRSVIACCKSYIHQLLGNIPLALQLAQHAIQLAHQCTPYLPVIIGLAHVMKILQEQKSPCLIDGIKLLRAYCRSLPHNPYSSLSCDPLDPYALYNPDQLTDSDLCIIHILTSIPSPLSFSPLSLTVPLDEDSDNANDSYPTGLSSFHYSTQGCGMLEDPTLPIDPLFLHDPMVLEELMELKHHGGEGIGEVEDSAVVV